MRFVFNERKATQTAAYLLGKYGGKHSYMAILKLMYLADRHTLVETGVPITGDAMYSMKHGTVLSAVLNLMSCGAETGPWVESITQAGQYTIKIEKNPGVDDLSEYETEVLDQVFETWGDLDQWSLREFTHTLPEWEDPGETSRRIDPKRILELENLPPKVIDERIQNAESAWRMSQLHAWTR